MTARWFLLSPLLLSGLGGCLSPVQQASAGSIGCPPGEIVVADVKDGSWSATCRGRKFWCSPGEPATCTEELPRAGAGEPTGEPDPTAPPATPATPEPAAPPTDAPADGADASAPPQRLAP
jgi:hypothetical protein